MKSNFVILWGSGRDFIDYMCNDLKKYKNVQCINSKYANTWEEKREYFYNKYKNTKVSNILFYLWLYNELHLKLNRKNYIIFLEDYIKAVDWDILNYLKEKLKIYTVLYIDDPIKKRMNKSKNRLDIYRKKIDLIITTDHVDAKDYKLSFFPLIYSKPDIVDDTKVVYDLSFIGRTKNRTNLVKNIEKKLLQKNRKVYIQFREGLREGQGIKGWMSYKEVIDIVKQSNCILEIVQEGQNAITLRTMEAVCYGKKLLTNNKNIIKYPFYDSRFISVFEDIDDINLEFISRKENVVYNYKGEYSPEKFLRYIVKKIGE